MYQPHILMHTVNAMKMIFLLLGFSSNARITNAKWVLHRTRNGMSTVKNIYIILPKWIFSAGHYSFPLNNTYDNVCETTFSPCGKGLHKSPNLCFWIVLIRISAFLDYNPQAKRTPEGKDTYVSEDISPNIWLRISFREKQKI